MQRAEGLASVRADGDAVAGSAFSRCWSRPLLFAAGLIFVLLGLIGAVVPGMPTTVFLLMALWAFSKSSARFHSWLWSHPRFGAPLRAWHEHRVIPRRAKYLAVASMTVSFVGVVAFIAADWVLPTAMAAGMLPAAIYILTRASVPVTSVEQSPRVSVEQ